MKKQKIGECTEEELEELQPEVIRNKLKPIARAYFLKHHREVGEAIFQHFASLPALKMSNLMFKKGRLRAWVEELGIKTAAQCEKGAANRKRNNGKQFGVGKNATDHETTFHLQLLRYTNHGNNEKSPTEILQLFANIIFEITGNLQHTFRLVAPQNEIDAIPISSKKDIPEDSSKYIMNGHYTTPRTYTMDIKIISSLQVGALNNLSNTECFEAARKFVAYTKQHN